MGKKKVFGQTQEEALKERDTVEAGVARATAGALVGKHLASGRVYIVASYNNTLVTVTDARGNTVAWASAGSLGFSGPKKATPFAASKVIAAVAEKLKKTGLSDIEILVRGVGSGRDSAVRSLVNQGFRISSIRDVTSVPHNGPRPKKVRRV